MAKDFREAHRLKKQEQNETLWLQGMYFYEGICAALSNAFGGKSNKKVSYPEKPYPLFQGEKTEEEKQKELEEKRLKAFQYFDSLVQAAREGRTML